MPTGFRTRRPLRRRNDAGRRVPYVPAAGMRPPERKRRRKGTLVRDRCGNCPSGEKTAPGDRLPTGLRTRRPLRRRNDAGKRFRTYQLRECALRRENDAGRAPLSVIAAGTAPPARKRRRETGYRRDSVREGPSGVEMTPGEGFRTCQLRERALRRQSRGNQRTPEGPGMTSPTVPRRTSGVSSAQCCHPSQTTAPGGPPCAPSPKRASMTSPLPR